MLLKVVGGQFCELPYVRMFYTNDIAFTNYLGDEKDGPSNKCALSFISSFNGKTITYNLSLKSCKAHWKDIQHLFELMNTESELGTDLKVTIYINYHDELISITDGIIITAAERPSEIIIEDSEEDRKSPFGLTPFDYSITSETMNKCINESKEALEKAGKILTDLSKKYTKPTDK